MRDLQELYEEQLRDVYDAEQQLVKALPKMAQAATSRQLKSAFEQHLDLTRQHVQRLERIFNTLNARPQGETCEAMQGLVKEGEEVSSKDGDSDVKDAALIAAAQRVEHYEIASYGTLVAYARQLAHDDAQDILETTLQEEKDTDSQLSELAMGSINKRANAH